MSKEVYEYWIKHKGVLMSISSHLVVFEMDKSIIRQQTLIEINQYPDCKVETMTIRNLLKELKKASKPLISNML